MDVAQYLGGKARRSAGVFHHLCRQRHRIRGGNPPWLIGQSGANNPAVNASPAPTVSTTLTEMRVVVPPTKAEQEAIAEALSDMDADLTTLEVKLAKARALKQGMIQELLTGRIRLV